jgi:hypothetical protein
MQWKMYYADLLREGTPIVTRNEIAAALSAYYAAQHIRVGKDFACPHRATCENFSKPRPLMKGMEAHVGHRYGEGRRLAVVSLDSGASEDLEAQTAIIEPITPETAGNPHMEGTAKFARLLINPSNPPDKPMAFAAMLNSAKCAGADGCMDTVKYEVHYQCRGYLLGELRILNPDLVWLQGSIVRHVLSERLTIPQDFVPRLRRYLGTQIKDNERLERHLGLIAHEYIHLLWPWDDGHKRCMATVVTPHPSDRSGRWRLFERALMPLVADVAIACAGTGAEAGLTV